jgi:NADPH:quinone reductase-like Zn-dependent oxidoreductase
MPRAVKFRSYGGPEVLEVLEVPRPLPAAGEVVVRVVTAALNPGEIGIREGVFATMWPAHFPEGQGNDFAGVVDELGPGVTRFAVGDEVIGYAPRQAQSEYVALPAGSVAPKPGALSWEQASAIAGVGATAWASVEAVRPRPGETVVVSAAAGGVGAIAAQLVLLREARVVGTSSPENFGFLRELGVVPVAYGNGLVERLRSAAPNGVDALVDTFGQGNVDAAIQLGVRPDRINTLADGRAARLYGVHTRAQEDVASAALYQRLAQMAAEGQFVIPIEKVYPLDQVRAAYRDVATRHGRGKRILAVAPPDAPRGTAGDSA